MEKDVVNQEEPAEGLIGSSEEVAEEIEESAASTTGEEASQGTTGEEGDKVLPGVQKRINKAVYKQKEAERKERMAQEERDYYRDRLLEKDKVEKDKVVEAKVEEEIKEPNSDDFETAEEYNKTLAKYEAQKAAAAATKPLLEKIEKLEKGTEDGQKEQNDKDIEAKFKRGREKYDDFDEALSNNIPYSYASREIVLKSNITDELAYYFKEHMDIAQRISDIGDPIETALEIGKIEAKIEIELAKLATNQEGKEGKTKPETKDVAEVITPVGSAEIIKKDLDKITDQEEYRKEYERQFPNG